MVAPAEKALMLGSQFDSKQCHEQFVTYLFCFPQSMCKFWAFRTSVVPRLFLDLDSYGGCLYIACVSSISKEGYGSKLSITFHKLICLESFPECWRSANVTAISKGAPSPGRENY